MRIAQVSPYNFEDAGGVQAVVRLLYKGLKEKGHYVKMIAPRKEKKSLPEMEDLILFGRCIRIPINKSKSDASIVMGKIENPVKKLLERERFDILHIHEPWVPSMTMQLINESTAGHVFHFHAKPYKDSLSLKMIERLFLPVENFVFDRADMVLASSYSSASYVESFTDKEIKIFNNPVDTGVFNPKAKPIKEYIDGKFNIVFIGRLDKRKGVDTLIQAFSLFSRENPESRLIIGGKGKYGKKLKKYIEENELRNVVMTGFVPEHEKANYYATADVFCAPAKGGESFGIVLAEAMACGKPVVCSAIEGYMQVIKDDGKMGLFAPGDVKALAETLKMVANDESLREKLSQWSLKAVQQYDYKKLCDVVEGYYEEIISDM